MGTLKQKFGARVRELRKTHKLSQDKFADIIDWDKANISNLENGKNFLKPESIEKIAEAFNVEVGELFNFEHFQDKAVLFEYIEKFLQKASLKDIKFIYKTIKNLAQYRD